MAGTGVVHRWFFGQEWSFWRVLESAPKVNGSPREGQEGETEGWTGLGDFSKIALRKTEGRMRTNRCEISSSSGRCESILGGRAVRAAPAIVGVIDPSLSCERPAKELDVARIWPSARRLHGLSGESSNASLILYRSLPTILTPYFQSPHQFRIHLASYLLSNWPNCLY